MWVESALEKSHLMWFSAVQATWNSSYIQSGYILFGSLNYATVPEPLSVDREILWKFWRSLLISQGLNLSQFYVYHRENSIQANKDYKCFMLWEKKIPGCCPTAEGEFAGSHQGGCQAVVDSNFGSFESVCGLVEAVLQTFRGYSNCKNKFEPKFQSLTNINTSIE